jgi:hypothetical protein
MAIHYLAQLELVQVNQKEKTLYVGLLQSPLTDSNRRPPLYH